MKGLKKYLNSRKINIDFLLEKPKRNYTPGTFHKLRIELKKLNAFLDLVNYCSKDFRKKKIFKPFKQVFRQAGKVRELQLQEAMLKKYFPDNSISGYKAFLRKSRLKETRNFFSIVTPKMISRIENKFIEVESFLPKIKTKTTSGYLNSETEKIKNLIKVSPLQMEQLHELRKRLKMLNNNRSSLSMDESKGPVSKKDGLPQLLGDWHDLQVMIGHLNKGLDYGGIDPNEVTQLENLKTKISAESDLLFGQIREGIPTSEFYESGN